MNTTNKFTNQRYMMLFCSEQDTDKIWVPNTMSGNGDFRASDPIRFAFKKAHGKNVLRVIGISNSYIDPYGCLGTTFTKESLKQLFESEKKICFLVYHDIAGKVKLYGNLDETLISAYRDLGDRLADEGIDYSAAKIKPLGDLIETL